MYSFYLAARFGRRDELNSYRLLLAEHGYTVTSRWLTQHQKLDLQAPGASYSEDERRAFALQDYIDVTRASHLVAFTEDPNDNAPGGRRGGRHVELGVAIALGKTVYIVGPRENVFCFLPGITCFDNFNQLLEVL